MYSRKSVGPRMESWGTPALTGSDSCSYKKVFWKNAANLE